MARGVSIHIGLNWLGGHYNGEEYKALEGCVNDANLMRDIAFKKGFHEQISFITDATFDEERLKTENILKCIESYGKGSVNELVKGDILLITYSGHGSQVNGRNNQTWCFFDRMVIDAELAELWSKFNAGVKILFISDSCHSGTVFGDIEAEDEILIVEEITEAIAFFVGNSLMATFENTVTVELNAKNLKNARSRMFATGLAGGIFDRSPVYEHIRAKALQNNFAVNVEACLISLAACLDDQVAIEIPFENGIVNGVFTKALSTVLNNSESNINNYADFFTLIKNKTNEINNDQNPYMFPSEIGASIEEDMKQFPAVDTTDWENFIKSNKPFEITGNIIEFNPA
jgi:Caspase domain